MKVAVFRMKQAFELIKAYFEYKNFNGYQRKNPCQPRLIRGFRHEKKLNTLNPYPIQMYCSFFNVYDAFYESRYFPHETPLSLYKQCF
jgi:hypothetical protein